MQRGGNRASPADAPAAAGTGVPAGAHPGRRVGASVTPGRSGRRTPPNGAGALGDRLRVVEREGYRVTPQRRAILEAMLGAGRINVSAEEICRGARTVCPTVNLATTYRTLELLGRLGLARRLTYGDGRSVFCANPRPHYHGTCLRCGAVVDLPRGRVAEILDREHPALTDGTFVVVNHRVEFYGYCAACRAPAEAGR